MMEATLGIFISPKGKMNVSINLDAKTKELQSFYNWGKNQGEAKYSKEECQKIAEEFVRNTVRKYN